MTDREKAIVTAYTGITMLTGEKFSIFHKYIEDLLGRPVCTHELANEAIWTECCDAINELDISFGQVELDCYKVAGYIAICNAAVEDSDIDLLDAIVVALMQSLGKAKSKPDFLELCKTEEQAVTISFDDIMLLDPEKKHE